MPRRDLLIRDIPESLHEWIENGRYSRHMSKTEFILKSLHERAASPAEPRGQSTLFDLRPQPPQPPTGTFPFTFIDLFAGIGGMRLGLQRAGGRNVFSSEWDRYAQKTYCAWFDHMPHGDVRKITPDEIPDHDILAAGFPCQPFSIAGVSKKNSLGRLHGFEDESQGNLFFVLAAIAEAKRPLAMILENVKNLISHDKGRTWATIKRTLEDLDYLVFNKVIDARDYVPQHRERIFIVCFDRHVFGDTVPFSFPSPPAGQKPQLNAILEVDPPSKYTLSDHLWRYLQEYAQRHKEKGNGFGFGLADLESVSRTLSARYYKDGSEILIPQKDRNPRRLTPRECARLMGFPDDLPIVVSDTQAYRQFGNSLVPPIAEAVARAVTSVFHATMLSRGVSRFMAATTAKACSGSSREVQHLVATR